MADYLRILLLYYANPRRAASETLDHLRLGVAVALAFATALALQAPSVIAERRFMFEAASVQARYASQDGEVAKTPEAQEAARRLAEAASAAYRDDAWTLFPTTKALPELLMVMGLFVPGTIGLLAAWEGRGRCSVAISREFGSVLLCTAMSWTAARLPLAALQLAGFMPPWLPAISGAVFLVMAAVSLRTALGTRVAPAAVTSALGGGLLAAGGAVSVSLTPFVYMLASPCLLYYLWGSFNFGFSSVGATVSARQSFRRALEATTINPKDADAHYQLGLVHLQRRNLTEAEARFRTAAEIEREDADYAFYLGRALAEQGRPQEALEYFERAARLNDKTSSSEVWREIGAARIALGKWKESLEPLERYVDRREYDPAGLVYFGEALQKDGRAAEARQMFERAIEAAKTMPHHRRAETRPWAGRARANLRALGKA